MERGNSAPRTSVLIDPSVRERHGWVTVMTDPLKTAQLAARDPVWPWRASMMTGAMVMGLDDVV